VTGGLRLANVLLVQRAKGSVEGALLGVSWTRARGDVEVVVDGFRCLALERDWAAEPSDEDVLDRVCSCKGAFGAELAELACRLAPQVLCEDGRGALAEREPRAGDLEEHLHSSKATPLENQGRSEPRTACPQTPCLP
jgi:hypothetical protein